MAEERERITSASQCLGLNDFCEIRMALPSSAAQYEVVWRVSQPFERSMANW